MSGTAAHTSGTGFWHARDSHPYARATPPTDLYPAMRRRDSSAQIIEILFVGREIRRSTILAHKLPCNLEGRPLPSGLDLAFVNEAQTFLHKGRLCLSGHLLELIESCTVPRFEPRVHICLHPVYCITDDRIVLPCNIGYWC